MSTQNEGCEARRHFLKLSATAAAIVWVGGIPEVSRASELPHLSEDDATAKVLGYVEDASKTTDARFKTGQKCANCQLYTAGPSGYGPCQIFPGKSVNGAGWCSSYMPKKS